MLAVYTANVSLLDIYMVSNPYFIHLTNFFTLAMLPIPLVHFYQEQVINKLQNVYQISSVLRITNVAV